MSKGCVSVIIPCYNYGHFLPRAVASVVAQTYRNWEIIIVNDGSTDDTEEVSNSLINEGLSIRYLDRKENMGPSFTRNEGIAAANGEYLAFLDADDEWFSEKLEKQIEVFSGNPSVGLVATGVTLKDVNKCVERYYQPEKFADKRALVRSLLIRNIVPATSSVMVRKSCFENVGGFDKNFRFAEDWELWLRLIRECGFEFIYEPLITLYEHQSNASRAILKMGASREKIIRAHYPWMRENGYATKTDFFKALSYCYLDNARGYNNLRIDRKRLLVNAAKAILYYPPKCNIKDDKYQILIKNILPATLVKVLKRLKPGGSDKNENAC